MAFTTGQRDALIHSLDKTAAAPTVAGLQETKLIASIMRTVLPNVSDDDMVRMNFRMYVCISDLTLFSVRQHSPSSFGGLHTALLGVVASLFANTDWMRHVVPVTEGEARDAEAQTTGKYDNFSLQSCKTRD
jgi:nuclear pore complex protein Nup205